MSLVTLLLGCGLAGVLAGPLGDGVRADCATAATPCVLSGDFDGDGRTDRVVQVRETTCAEPPCGRGLVFLFADRSELLGLRPGVWERLEADGAEPVNEKMPDDFSFLEAWAVVTPAGRPGPTTPRPPSDAMGDAVWMSSSDAAILVYRASSGWRYVDLGY